MADRLGSWIARARALLAWVPWPVARTCRRIAAADGMGRGRCMVMPPRPSWDLAMGLSMEKPKAVAACLLAGYREWTVKGFKGKEPRFTSIDPDMEKVDQLIQDELIGRVSHISKEKLDKSLVPWTEHEKMIRTAVIVAEMKHRGVEVTEMNAVHLAAILCAAVPTDPAFLVPYNDAFSYEECVGVSGRALPVDSSVEPAAQPCGGMWVGDPKVLARVEGSSPTNGLSQDGCRPS